MILEKASNVLKDKDGAAADVVVAITEFSTSHTSFRKLLTQACGVRYASMPLFEREMFFGAMDVDWKDLAVSTNVLARALTDADRCEVYSVNGTHLVLGVSGRPVLADDGMLDQRGSFGNLPAGEVFLAPVEGTTEGILVLEWGPQAKFKNPITVTIESGKVLSVDGEEEEDVSWLEGILSDHEDNVNIAELGIGTNPAATRPDNILESEKILGTIHVAFGDNHTFGGNVKAPLHQDFVLFNATLTAVWERGGGRRVLLDEGKKGW
jgi:leucyl aminopeptidase (aminopeptidase T)